MRVAIISDIHANRHAFEAVLDDIAESSVEEVWCLGDLVGYGGEPDACVSLAREHATVCLAGNHDLAVTGDVSLEDFSRTAAAAVRWTRGAISDKTREFLGGLRPAGERYAVGLYHASPREPVWEYVLAAGLAERCLDTQTHRMCLIGHSHVALSFERQVGASVTGAWRGEGSEVGLGDSEWLLNPGSVGQPRDGDPRAACAIYDSEAGVVDYRRIVYDVEGAQRKIREAGLPPILADRLSVGR